MPIQIYKGIWKAGVIVLGPVDSRLTFHSHSATE